MEQDFAKIIMNPVRQRIIQYLIINKCGTVSEISRELSDIPRASLYRHINTLRTSGFIESVDEKAIRGATEKTYALAYNPLGNSDTHEISHMIQNTIITVAASFASYFKNDNANPTSDMLCVSSCTMMLSDSEMSELIQKIGEVYSNYISNKPDVNRKPRCLTFISSPAQDNI